MGNVEIFSSKLLLYSSSLAIENQNIVASNTSRMRGKVN